MSGSGRKKKGARNWSRLAMLAVPAGIVTGLIAGGLFGNIAIGVAIGAALGFSGTVALLAAALVFRSEGGSD